MKKQSKFINLNDFISDNYATTFILGARGVGKTIGAFLLMINNFVNHNTKGVYMRRYNTEIETTAIDLSLLSELSNHKISRDKVDVNGVTTDMILVDNKPAIYMVALSVAGKYKSNSYSDVEIIIYDEFIDLRNRELKNETKLFLNFAMTVFRDFTKYKALFLANNTNIFNNYFLDFEIIPTGKITKFRNKGIKIVVYKTSVTLDNERNSTSLAKLVRDIEGENNSSLSNIAVGNFEDFIRKLDKNCRYLGTYKLDGQCFGCYVTKQNDFIISKKYDLSSNYSCALSYDDVSEEFPLVDFQRYMYLRNSFYNLHVFFTDVKTRSMFVKKFKNNTFNI